MSELVYDADLKSAAREGLGVQISSPPFYAALTLIGKGVVLKTTSNHLRRGVSVRVRGFPQNITGNGVIVAHPHRGGRF